MDQLITEPPGVLEFLRGWEGKSKRLGERYPDGKATPKGGNWGGESKFTFGCETYLGFKYTKEIRI